MSKFKFYPTVDNPYMFDQFPRFMINFSSKRWKNRQKKIETEKEIILDSGGFHEIKKHGEYSFSVKHYLNQVRDVIKPDCFACMDWMCEPKQLERSGLSVDEHIENTVDNAIEILNKWDGKVDPMVVIQGWEIQDYINCIQKLNDHGCITERMGIGSICREGQKQRVKDIITTVDTILPNTKLHGFGIKKTFLKDPDVVDALYSSDSFAWSMANNFNYDFRGKNRKEYLGKWAREVELTAYRSLLKKKINGKYNQKTLDEARE